MAEEVEHLIARAREERARADGRKGGRPPKDSAPPAENGHDPNMTERQYLALVERTGRSIPELEKRFYG